VGEGLTEAVGPAEKGGLSRRNALKAGVAVGVGVAAWSGASITSLGGTPAYAQGCTGVIHVDLSGGCRNTDQGTPCPGGGSFRFHTFNTTFQAGFSLTNNPAEGTCCDVVATNQPVLNFTLNNLTCVSHVQVFVGGITVCQNASVAPLVDEESTGSSGASGGGSVLIDASCFGFTGANALPPNSFYTIFANCATTGAPETCF
jgi:hypothetical protein